MLNRKISDLPVVSESQLIYESPDGGKTVYAREIGTDKRYIIKNDDGGFKRQEMYKRSKRLVRILNLAENDPTLNDALQKLEALYILKYGDAKND